MDVKLKTCPFCGGEARILQLNDGKYFVTCFPGCSVKPITVPDESMDKVVEAWNTRADA